MGAYAPAVSLLSLVNQSPYFAFGGIVGMSFCKNKIINKRAQTLQESGLIPFPSLHLFFIYSPPFPVEGAQSR